MEAGCSPEGSLYAQLDRLEQSLDSELNELQGFLNQAHESSNDLGQDEIDVLDNDISSESNLFSKAEACCNETCIVKSSSRRECNGEIAFREACYICGKHSYHGEVALDLQHAFDTNFEDIPVILSMIQQQQNEFMPHPCDSENDSPETDSFIGPLHEFETAQNFFISEVSSERVAGDTAKLDPNWQVYYELVGDTSNLFRDIIFACSRIHSKGKQFISIYFEGVLYTAVQHDHDDYLGLLDLDFLAYFTGGKEGATLAMYNDTTWMKLSAWKRVQRRESQMSLPNISISPKSESMHSGNLADLVSDSYVQSYYILKPKENNCKEREVMFRFGSWFYSGNVILPTMKNLQDIPNVIRQMRLAQHKLEFVGDVSSLSASNKFVKPMQYSTLISKRMEEEAIGCEDYLHEIMTQADPGKEGKHWLEDDSTTCFFEFACDSDEILSPTSEILEAIELVCSKVYNASGVISTSIIYEGLCYLQLEEMPGELPLLDSKFPDLSKKKGGCHLKTYPRGREGWPELRSVSIWQSSLRTDVQDEVNLSTNGTKMSKTARKQRKHSFSLLPVRRKNRLL